MLGLKLNHVSKRGHWGLYTGAVLRLLEDQTVTNHTQSCSISDGKCFICMQANILKFEIYFTGAFVPTNQSWLKYRVTLLNVISTRTLKSLLCRCYDSKLVITWIKLYHYDFAKIADRWRLYRIWLCYIVTRPHVWLKANYGNNVLTLLRSKPVV